MPLLLSSCSSRLAALLSSWVVGLNRNENFYLILHFVSHSSCPLPFHSLQKSLSTNSIRTDLAGLLCPTSCYCPADIIIVRLWQNNERTISYFPLPQFQFTWFVFSFAVIQIHWETGGQEHCLWVYSTHSIELVSLVKEEDIAKINKYPRQEAENNWSHQWR